MASSALAYIDTQLDGEGVRESVRRLIEQEMRSFRPARDYVAHLPLPELGLEGTHLLQSELMRMSDGQPMAPLDMTHLAIDPPAQGRENPSAWQQAIENAKSQIEHQVNRADNLALLQQHGPDAWRTHMDELKHSLLMINTQLDAVKSDTDLINRKRKYEQLEAARKLRALENDWLEAVHKNHAIEAAIERVRAEHEALQPALDQAE
mmetsp:Transcript_13079/g.34086  ORF Transcript_13079/g.34086 Transcript_13079/m.34086 type:complete len:207 (-) Transcript_13079:99-719(-)